LEIILRTLAINLPGAFYAAPTWVRKNCPEEVEGIVAWLSMAGAGVHGLAYLLLGNEIINNIFNTDTSNPIHLPLYLLPLVTNSLSWGYETFRNRKEDLE